MKTKSLKLLVVCGIAACVCLVMWAGAASTAADPPAYPAPSVSGSNGRPVTVEGVSEIKLTFYVNGIAHQRSSLPATINVDNGDLLELDVSGVYTGPVGTYGYIGVWNPYTAVMSGKLMHPGVTTKAKMSFWPTTGTYYIYAVWVKSGGNPQNAVITVNVA